MRRNDLITLMLLMPLALVFGLWAFGADYSMAGLTAAALSAGLYGLCLAGWAPALINWLASEEAAREDTALRANRFLRKHPWPQIALLTLLLHLILYALGYAFDLWQNGYSGGVLDAARRLWLRSDAPHYLGIAANWYVTEGDPRFHIVFLPLYPMLIRAATLLTGDGFRAAMLVSNLCAAGAAILAYELAALDMPRKRALYAALVLSILPGGIFLAAPMSESLFLALSLACVYSARRGRYFLAGGLGALAAFTRSVGALLVVPLLLEAVRDGRGRGRKAMAARLCGVAMVALGTAAYLLVNYSVTGGPFTFLAYQREHWGQRLGLFFNTAAYQTDCFLGAVATGDAPMAYTLYLPNLICCFAALGITLWGAPRLRPSYTAYSLAYFAVAVGPVSLLSGPRYLAVCFPLAFAIAEAAQGKRPLRWAAAGLLAAGMGIYLYMYVMGYYVY